MSRYDAFTFVKLWTQDGDVWAVEVADEPRIDAAVQKYLQAGGDTLLDLTLTGGDSLRLLASRVTSWMVCTPAGRRREMELDRDSDEERKRIQIELGIWEES